MLGIRYLGRVAIDLFVGEISEFLGDCYLINAADASSTTGFNGIAANLVTFDDYSHDSLATALESCLRNLTDSHGRHLVIGMADHDVSQHLPTVFLALKSMAPEINQKRKLERVTIVLHDVSYYKSAQAILFGEFSEAP